MSIQEERVIFEFLYDYGTPLAAPAHLAGSLPRADFELLFSGRMPGLVQIHDVRQWDEGREAIVLISPRTGDPAGSAYFRTDAIRRLWPLKSLGRGSQVPEAVRAPSVLRTLEDFFGGPVTEPRFFSEKLSESDLPNLDLALEDFIRREATTHKLLGFAEDPFQRVVGLRAALSSPTRHGFPPLATGPALWKRAAVGVGQYRDCLSQGIHLIESRSGRLALALAPERHGREGWNLEVLALDAAVARDALDSLRETMVRLNVYRGKTITLKPARESCGGYTIEFVSLDAPGREQIILPQGLLELIERNAFGVQAHRERLLAAGRHLRRGLLFHGKPGTGKTFTAKHILSRLQGHTAVLLAGPSLGLIEQACGLARLLAPSVVVIEDVDLVARERTDNRFVSILHDLLDQMDGLGNKVEVLFILTTNRPDLLEPALASRPGRVDQAIEFPLPDRSGRARLFELYARGMRLEADIDLFLDRTDGASGAFIAELLRRALVFACEQGSAEVRAEHLESALREIVLSGGGLTRSLLGFEEPPAAS